MKTYVIVGAVVGIVGVFTAGLLGINMNDWLMMGLGATAALIAGQIERRKK